MPIILQHAVSRISQSEFKALDYAVMGAAYEIQNELGRLFDESVYSNALHERLSAKNISSTREFEIQVTHQDFKKSYYIDLLIHSCVPYELKTTAQFNTAHDSQLLNYLLLTNLAHGKLINFQRASVDGRFISTSLTQDNRTQFKIHTNNWKEHTETPAILPLLKALLHDWGTHLATELYQEAIIHFAANKATYRQIELNKDGTPLGYIRPPMISPTTMLCVSSLSRNCKEQREHLQKILKMSQLEQVQWINFHHHTVELETIT